MNLSHLGLREELWRVMQNELPLPLHLEAPGTATEERR